ncbi:MAG: hypothetical protein Q9174_004073, partial [Haloplaca sp. 1 TL-2023]
MRSQLTRRVFRQIVHNAVYADACCACRPAVQHARHARVTSTPSRVHSRTWFSFAKEPTRRQKLPDYKPGLKEMTELSQALAKHERPPSRATLAQAFTTVILDHTTKQSKLVEDSDIGLMLTTFRYLITPNTEEDGHRLSVEEISHVLNALVTAGPDRSTKAPNLVTLAEALYEALKSREGVTDEIRISSLKSLITILADRYKPQEARDLLAELRAMDPSLVEARQWTDVLVGFARIDDQDQIMKTIEIIQDQGVPYDSQVHQSLLLYYAAQKNVSRMKEWCEFGKAKRLDLPRKAQVAVLKVCTNHGELEWGEPIMRAYTDQEPSNKADQITAWGMILRWAAAKGNGFDELDRMLKLLVQKSMEQGSKIEPEIRIINGLIAIANMKKDAYAAERYLALGQKWGLQPDERTLTLQFEYRMDSGDLDGARAVYYDLKSHWPSLEELGSDMSNKFGGLHLVNRFIVKLCERKPLKYDLIMELVADLQERQ